MSAHVVKQQSEFLTSWKEIASYLGKGIRTVQRWEQQFGLPVRRPNEKVKGIVHATRQELDEWLARQWSQRPKEFAYANHIDPIYIEEVRKAVLQSAELRKANRLLLQDIRMSVQQMFSECEAMTAQLTPRDWVTKSSSL